MAAWASQRTGNWALVSTDPASPWYDNSTQSGYATVPGASGTDTVTITATHVVTYDYDMSAAGVLSALVINGTLTASTGTGNWYLKMGGTAGQDITFGAAGYLLAGSSGTALPVTAVFTIDLNGASKISCGSGPSGCVALYCTSPTWVGVRVAGAEAIGQTTLEIDGYKLASTGVVETGKDLTTDTMWAAPRGVRIDNVNKAVNSEARVIASTAAGAVVVTAGLTATKIAGTWIWLTWRNVRIIGYSGTTGAIYQGTGQALNCEIALVSTGYGIGSTTSSVMGAGIVHGGAVALMSCTSFTLQGSAVISGCSNGVSSCTSPIVQGSAVVSGCSNGVNSCTSPTIQGSALVSGCSTALGSCPAMIVQGSAVIDGSGNGASTCHGFILLGSALIRNCTTGLFTCSGNMRDSASITGCTSGIRMGAYILRGVTLNNTTDINPAATEVSDVRGWGVSLSGATQVAGYRATVQAGNIYTCIWDIGAVEGAVKAWTYGGVVASVATEPTNWPASPAFVESYQHTFESVNGPVFLDKPIYGKAGELITIDIYCKMSASGMSTRGTFVLIDPDQPLPIPTTTLDSEVMADNTDWQKLTLTYTPTYDRELTLRAYGVNASGTLIWREVVTFGAAASGGGSIFGGAIVR